VEHVRVDGMSDSAKPGEDVEPDQGRDRTLDAQRVGLDARENAVAVVVGERPNGAQMQVEGVAIDMRERVANGRGDATARREPPSKLEHSDTHGATVRDLTRRTARESHGAVTGGSIDAIGGNVGGTSEAAPSPARTTIFVICFNYARFLARAVESALGQDDGGVRVAVVDDGSTDETPKVAASFGGRIVYYRKANGGLSDARNFAAERCDTEFLVYLDADNCLPGDFVRRCRLRLEAEPGADFAFTQLRYFGDREGTSAFPPFDPSRLKKGGCIDACCLLRSEVVRRYHYDVRLRDGLEDWDFYLTLAGNGLAAELVEETYVWYRVHGSSMGHGVQRDRRRRQRTYLRILRKHRRFVGIGAIVRMVGRSLRHRARLRLTAAGGRRAAA
jgi:GT2 family glycosyltransferase